MGLWFKMINAMLRLAFYGKWMFDFNEIIYKQNGGKIGCIWWLLFLILDKIRTIKNTQFKYCLLV